MKRRWTNDKIYWIFDAYGSIQVSCTKTTSNEYTRIVYEGVLESSCANNFNHIVYIYIKTVDCILSKTKIVRIKIDICINKQSILNQEYSSKYYIFQLHKHSSNWYVRIYIGMLFFLVHLLFVFHFFWLFFFTCNILAILYIVAINVENLCIENCWAQMNLFNIIPFYWRVRNFWFVIHLKCEQMCARGDWMKLLYVLEIEKVVWLNSFCVVIYWNKTKQTHIQRAIIKLHKNWIWSIQK